MFVNDQLKITLIPSILKISVLLLFKIKVPYKFTSSWGKRKISWNIQYGKTISKNRPKNLTLIYYDRASIWRSVDLRNIHLFNKQIYCTNVTDRTDTARECWTMRSVAFLCDFCCWFKTKLCTWIAMSKTNLQRSVNVNEHYEFVKWFDSSHMLNGLHASALNEEWLLFVRKCFDFAVHVQMNIKLWLNEKLLEKPERV